MSFRSSPPVLAAVNRLAAELGTTQLRCADPDSWGADCRVEALTHHDTKAEADFLVTRLRCDLADCPELTIGVIARTTYRLSDLTAALDAADLSYQEWHQPLAQPHIAELLHHHLPDALAASTHRGKQLVALDRICRSHLSPDDATALDELSRAIENLGERLAVLTLAQAVGAVRSAGAPDRPVTPGLHLLTGHAGKGQEFDVVYVVGLEQGGVPDYRATSAEALREELRVLHVMASRARRRLAFTFAEHRWRRPTWYADETPSQWWTLLADLDHPTANLGMDGLGAGTTTPFVP